MSAYCRNRIELFTIAVFVGGAVSAIAFQYHGDQIAKYFDVQALHLYSSAFLVLAYLLPTLFFYLGIYWLNATTIRFLGKAELDEKRKVILRKLTDAALSNQAVTANPGDLEEEVAWESLQKFWRPQ